MIDACRAAGVPLWVGYYRRALPRFLAVRELVTSGAIGDVRMAVSYVTAAAAGRVGVRERAGAMAREPARCRAAASSSSPCCHTFDFLDFLFGPIVDVRGFAANQAGRYDAEDVVAASYRFASGVYGTRHVAASRPMRTSSTPSSSAPPGRLRFSTFAPVPIRILRGDTRRGAPGRRSRARAPAADPVDRRRA